MTLDTAESIYITAEGIVGLMSIVGNFIVLMAILKNPGLHTVPNVFIVNLTIADILVGVLVCPLAVIGAHDVSMEFINCLGLATAILVFTNASIFCLVGISFERFFAIKKPFEYEEWLTVRRAIFTNVFIWLISLLIGLVPMYGWHEDKDKYEGRCQFTNVVSLEYLVYFQAVLGAVIPMAVIFCVYAYIVYTVYKHELYQHTQRKTVLRLSEQLASQDKLQKYNMRAVKLFICVNVLFAITWLPLYIINCIAVFYPGCLGADKPRSIMFTLIVLSHANSSINPFLYAYSSTFIWNAVLRLFDNIRLNLYGITSMAPSCFQNPGYAPGHIEATRKPTSNVSDRRIVLSTP